MRAQSTKLFLDKPTMSSCSLDMKQPAQNGKLPVVKVPKLRAGPEHSRRCENQHFGHKLAEKL